MWTKGFTHPLYYYCRVGTFCILLYNWTFSTDLTDVSVAEIKNAPTASVEDLKQVNSSEKKQLLH